MTIAFVTGHAFNYALFWGANQILDSAGFGVFYTSVMTINVVMAPMLAVTLVLARRFAEIGATAGARSVAAMTWRLIRACIIAVPIAVAAGIMLAAVTPWFGIQGWQIVLLIPVTVLVLVIIEILRASLQGTLLFARASVLWIASIGAECLLSLVALYLFATVWTGIAGFLVGGLLAAAVSLPWFAGAAHREGAAVPSAMPLCLRREMPMIVGYSLFILYNNIDILLAYWLLSNQELGVYAASALLPKAIITATFAIAQVVLPVITEQRVGGQSFRLSAAKAVAMAALAAGFAAGILWLAIPFFQRTPLAIRGLDIQLMSILAIAAVALSIVRVLVVIEVALQRYAVGFAQAAALVLFPILCLSSRAGALQLAERYSMTSCAFLLLSCGIVTVTWIAPSHWMQGHLSRK